MKMNEILHYTKHNVWQAYYFYLNKLKKLIVDCKILCHLNINWPVKQMLIFREKEIFFVPLIQLIPIDIINLIIM